MNIEYEITKIKNQLQNLQDIVLQMSRNSVPTTSKVDDTANQVKAITPYTETKTAYYGEREKTFYNVPMGNVTVMFDNYNGNYSVGRIADRVTVSFDVLNEQTDITISVL